MVFPFSKYYSIFNLFWAGFLDVKYGRDVELATLVIFWGIRPISFKIYTVAIET